MRCRLAVRWLAVVGPERWVGPLCRLAVKRYPDEANAERWFLRYVEEERKARRGEPVAFVPLPVPESVEQLRALQRVVALALAVPSITVEDHDELRDDTGRVPVAKRASSASDPHRAG